MPRGSKSGKKRAERSARAWPRLDDNSKRAEAVEHEDEFSQLTEETALALLKRPELPAETFEELQRSQALMAMRKVRLAVVQHPRAPRHVVLAAMRHLFTFELMQTGLKPGVPADIRRTSEEMLIRRLETIPAGERLSLARRASGRVAGALLGDAEERVMRAALENGRITESAIVKALNSPGCTPTLVQAVCSHERWRLRVEIQVALLQNENTPLNRVLKIARSLPEAKVRDVLQTSSLPEQIKGYLQQEFKVAGK